MGTPYAEVIGDPVAQSRSPLIHNFWLERLGIDAEYRATRVTPGELADFLASRRTDPDWCGCNVTMPLKQAILSLLDEQTGAARLIGAVNTVTRSGGSPPRLIGHNTDGPGFLEPLGDWPESDKIYRIAMVIGTGGAAAAICWALKKRDFLLIHIARTRESGLAFQRDLGGGDPEFVGVLEDYARPPPLWNRSWPHQQDRADLLVNASPLGMAGQPPLPFDLANLPPGTLIYDLVTHPPDTDLLHRARAAGHPVIGGLDMLIGQAAGAFRLLFAFDAPRDHDAELRERLLA